MCPNHPPNLLPCLDHYATNAPVAHVMCQAACAHLSVGGLERAGHALQHAVLFRRERES
jgi:hypothetical protein